MIQVSRLKGKIVENGVNYIKCAKALGISVTAFSNKMSGKSKFSIEEVNTLAVFLGLNQNEILDIFFND